MINTDFEISGWIAIAQLVIIVIFGYLFSIIAKFRYRNSFVSLQIFKPGDYTSCFVDDPRIMFQTVPKWYYFVAVRYHPDGQVANETFYSIVGDVTVINFSDGRWSGTKSNLYSNLLLVALPFIGFVLILLTQSVSASVIVEQSDTSHEFIKYGTILFGSVFLSVPINMIFYFLTHFKRPLQQSNRG